MLVGVMLLFIFVVMMLNINIAEITAVGKEYAKNLPLGFIVGFLFIFEILSIFPDTGTLHFSLGIFNWLNGLLLGIENTGINTTNVNMAFTLSPENTFTNFQQVESIGQSLYTFGALWLIVVTIILLLAMVGPIVLCLRSTNTKESV